MNLCSSTDSMHKKLRLDKTLVVSMKHALFRQDHQAEARQRHESFI
jgi:hypothetical protein